MSRDHCSDKIWRCNDGGHHFVSLKAFDVGSKDQHAYLSLSLYEFAGGLRERITGALNILLHGRECCGEVLLDGVAGHEFEMEVARLNRAAYRARMNLPTGDFHWGDTP